jgi:hypothetical protein
MWWMIVLVTLLALLPLAAVELFMAMVAANGYMGNTDPMVTVYLLCMGGGLLAVSLLAGFIARVLAERFSLSLWLTGFISIVLAALIQPGLCLVAFFIAITFFAP